MRLTIGLMPRRKNPPTGFGKGLLALRKARGLTQVQLAEMTNSSQRAISYYENLESYPPTTAVVALARALRVTTDELLGLKNVDQGRHDIDPELQRVWKKFRQVTTLPERDQRAVIRLINSLAGAQQAIGSAQALQEIAPGP